MDSYSNALIKFTLSHYCDILWGKITPDEMQDFCQSMGRKNPLETALIWKVDIDQAIISLSSRHHGWKDAVSEGMSDSMILHLGRSNTVCNMQRDLINDCILKGCMKFCKNTGYGNPELCYHESIITRMKRYLNGLWLKENNRDPRGRFTVEANAP